MRGLLRTGQYRAMADTWRTITVSEIKPGDYVRLQTGHEFEVARIDSPFLGMDAMVCLIEDTPTRCSPLLFASTHPGHPLIRTPRYRQTGHGPMAVSPTTSRLRWLPSADRK